MKTQNVGASDGMNVLQSHNLTWVDVENPGDEVLAKLEADYHLHPVHLNESVQKIQHNQVEREDNYLFFVLHAPIYSPAVNKILVNQVGVFLGRDFMITIRTGTIPAVAAMFGECEQDVSQKDAYLHHGASRLLYTLISRILDDINDMTEIVVSELDSIEDVVFDNNGSDAQRIGKARQAIVRLSRVIGPKRLVLNDLTEQVDSFTGENVSKYYSNNTKTVNKLWEVIEEAKETVEIYKDADFTTSTEHTNQILAVLTIIFTLTIPITVVGTLYGMNVPLPGGTASGAWSFLGHYTTFGFLVIVSVLMAVAMYLYFRSKQWF